MRPPLIKTVEVRARQRSETSVTRQPKQCRVHVAGRRRYRWTGPVVFDLEI